MHIGVYISGLGQSFNEESVEKYAGRMMHEISYNHTGVAFTTQVEKIKYGQEQESTVVTIFKEGAGNAKAVIYKFYAFEYNELLTKEFNQLNIFLKNLILFWLVIKKIPLLFYRIFKPGDFGHARQTLYLFGIFLIVAFAILFILPTAIGILLNFLGTDAYSSMVATIKSNMPALTKWGITRKNLAGLADTFISITALLLILMPQAKVIVTSLATEFVCANNYLEMGKQSQHIIGNLEQLIEYIAEQETDAKLHFHTYSFGSIVALDVLFPVFGTAPSLNVRRLTQLLITVGTPVEFIKAYYTGFYQRRNTDMNHQFSWYNVYSVADALGSNFRCDTESGDATESVVMNGMLPTNLNYEISSVKRNTVVDAMLLGGVKAHSVYWDNTAIGHSCLRNIIYEMEKQALL
jgi:hypothetical protein